MKHIKHFKCKIIISSQFINDLNPASRVQLDFFLLFKGFPKEKIEDVFPQLDLVRIDFEKFYKIYQDVTKEKHNFLYINKNENEIRLNFNQQIIFKNES